MTCTRYIAVSDVKRSSNLGTLVWKFEFKFDLHTLVFESQFKICPLFSHSNDQPCTDDWWFCCRFYRNILQHRITIKHAVNKTRIWPGPKIDHYLLSVILATITQSEVCILCSCGWYLSNVGQHCTQGSKILP